MVVGFFIDKLLSLGLDAGFDYADNGKGESFLDEGDKVVEILALEREEQVFVVALFLLVVIVGRAVDVSVVESNFS